MTGGAEKTLSDEAIVDLLDLGATVEWTQPRDTTAQHLLDQGWSPTRRGVRLMHPEGLSGSVTGASDTLAINQAHTVWAPDTDTTADESVQRIAHVVSVVRGHLDAEPQVIRLDTGLFAARWLLDSEASVLVDSRTVTYNSPTLTAAGTFRVEASEAWAAYLGE